MPRDRRSNPTQPRRMGMAIGRPRPGPASGHAPQLRVLARRAPGTRVAAQLAMRQHDTAIASDSPTSSKKSLPPVGKKPRTDTATAPPKKKKDKKATAKKKPEKSAEYFPWVSHWCQILSTTQVLEMDLETGTGAGIEAVVAAGKRALVIAEIVNGPIQIELNEEDETGGLRRVWIEREDATLILGPEDEDLMSTDPALASAAAQANDKKTKNTVAAISELGDMDKLDAGFCAVAGKVIEGLVPEEGDSSELVLRVNIPLGGGYLFFSFTGSCERDNMIDDTQYKARFEFAGGLGVGGTAWIFKAFLEASVFGYIEASGDTGREVFDLMTYAIADKVGSVNEEAAAYVFSGGATKASVAKDMDREDYAQLGVGVRIAGGIGVGDASVEGSAEYSFAGTRYSGNGEKGKETGKVNEASVETFAAGLSFESGALSFAGSLEAMWIEGGPLKSVVGAVGASLTLDLAELRDLVGSERGAALFAAWAGDAATAIAPMVARAFKEAGVSVSGDKDPSKHILSTVGKISGANVALELAKTEAFKALASPDSYIGKLAGGALAPEVASDLAYEVSMELDYKHGIGYCFSVQLKRVSTIEFGEERSGPAYVKVENATRLIQLRLYNDQAFK
jgi:hypothetical protein